MTTLVCVKNFYPLLYYEIFYIEPDLKKSWGIIEISLQTSANTQFEKVLGSHFKIRLDARKVFWTYYFDGTRDEQTKKL